MNLSQLLRWEFSETCMKNHKLSPITSPITEFTVPTRPSSHYVEVCTHHTMQAHTDRRCLYVTHFSQSTPTFYSMHSVYPAPLTCIYPLKPSLHYPSSANLAYTYSPPHPSSTLVNVFSFSLHFCF